MFSEIKIPRSEYPRDFIPNGAKVFIGMDPGSKDESCTVKGFCLDGVYHIQEVIQLKLIN